MDRGLTRTLPDPAAVALVAEPPIPVTVLTGFLGSGKTTLIRRLLEEPETRNTAVVVNEFGEIGLDHVLLETSEEDTMLLPGGCLCCQAHGDLVRALRSLLDRRERRELPPYERVIVETSGLADPGPILQTLMADPLRLSRYEPAGLVTVVDAILGAETLDRHPIAERQVALADRILLSKLDLADGAREEGLRARLAELGRAGIAGVEESSLLRALLFDFATAGLERPVPARPDRLHHAARFETIVRHIDMPVSLRVLQSGIEALAASRGQDLLRLKAVLRVVEDPRPVALHAVQHLVHLPRFLDAAAQIEIPSLVAIVPAEARDGMAAAIDGPIRWAGRDTQRSRI